MKISPLLCALIAVLPITATAGSLTGTVSAGYSDNGAASDISVFTDFTWAMDLGWGGIELGSFGMWTQEIHPHETYAAVFADIAGGRLSAGVPRPAYDLFAVAEVDSAFPVAGFNVLRQTRSFATYASAEAEEVPIGLSYRSSSAGRGRYALSIHEIDALDTRLLSLGAEYDAGSWAIAGGLELIEGPDSTDTNAKVQVVAHMDQTNLSIGYFGNGADEVADLAELTIDHRLSDNLSAAGFALVPLESSADTIFGTSAKYAWGEHLYLQAGVAHQTNNDTSYSATVGWRF